MKHNKNVVSLFLVAALAACGGSSGSNNGTSSGTSPGATPTPSPTPPPSGNLLFFDNFEYAADRNNASAATAFLAAGWSAVKSIQTSGGYNGYVYTANSIPGFAGNFPGGGSRVLVLESLGGSLGGQTDFYLQLGQPESASSEGFIPGDVWFQFWIYIANTPEQPSLIDNRNKFIYPCNAAYPCTAGNAKWLMSMGAYTYEPLNQQVFGRPSAEGAFLMLNGDGRYTAAAPENEPKLGQTNIGEHIAANRWTLVKIHIDTSGPSGRYEAWMKPRGGQWAKVAEWIDGTTPNFTWQLAPEQRGGHRGFRMPTTMGEAPLERPRYDAWIYMDDFAMAGSESALPSY